MLGLRVEGQWDAANGPQYLLIDGHGSTRGLMSQAGAVTSRYDYDAFGNALDFEENTAATPWLFGGDGLYDPSTGWTYQLARWRDGDVFTSFDSFEADPSSPASLHKYTYANVDPITGYDPAGYYTQAFGYAAHDVIGAAYEATHPYSVINPTIGVFSSLKPDIFDSLNHGYAEIKPLSFPGITSGLIQIEAYDGVYGVNGELGLNYHRITDWPVRPTLTTVVAADGESDEVAYFNVDGLIFYTNLVEDFEDLKQLRNPSELYKYLRESLKNQIETIKDTAENLAERVFGEEGADLGATEGVAALDSLEGV